MQHGSSPTSCAGSLSDCEHNRTDNYQEGHEQGYADARAGKRYDNPPEKGNQWNAGYDKGYDDTAIAVSHSEPAR